MTTESTRPIKVLVEFPDNASARYIEAVTARLDEWLKSPESGVFGLAGVKAVNVMLGAGPYVLSEEVGACRYTIAGPSIDEVMAMRERAFPPAAVCAASHHELLASIDASRRKGHLFADDWPSSVQDICSVRVAGETPDVTPAEVNVSNGRGGVSFSYRDPCVICGSHDFEQSADGSTGWEFRPKGSPITKQYVRIITADPDVPPPVEIGGPA